MYRKVGLIILVAFGLVQQGFTQVSNSPLTQQGVGDIYGAHQPNSFGMGGIGISNGDVRYLNNQNPALLVYNSIYTYSAGVIGESRSAADDVNSQKSGDMNLSHLGMSFPIKAGKWVSSIMLSPYSNVEYQFIDNGIVEDVTFETRQRGSQGLVQLEWAHGFKIANNFRVGAKAKYLFGSIRRESANGLTNSSVNTLNIPTIADRDAVSDILIGFGAQYRVALPQGNFLNFGLIYDLQSDVNTRRLRTLETRNGADIVLSSDTLINDVKGKMKLPATLGFGISMGKPLKWLAGIDVRMQPWSNFQTYEGTDGGLQNSLSVALGGEYTPDAGSIDKILRRVTYRIGMSYEKTPYVLNDSGVNDLGINFGGSIPVGGISSLDMGFRFGKRGSMGSNQFKEDYFRLQLGVTFNDRLWFIKRKFD
jgi:hypothetical protein